MSTRPFICFCELTREEEEESKLSCHGVRGFHNFEVIGHVPVRTSTGLTWKCSGTVEGWYTCIDVWLATERGWKIESVKCLFMWEEWAMPYAPLFQDLFKLKKKGKKENNKSMYIMAKLIMNSIFGKTIQRDVKPSVFFEFEREQQMYGLMNANNYKNERPVQIGSFVLAWSRVIFYQIVKYITQEGGEFLYGDTDSCITQAEVVNKMRVDHPEWFGSDLVMVQEKERYKVEDFAFSLEEEHCDCSDMAEEDRAYDKLITIAKKNYTILCSKCMFEKVRSKGHNVNDLSFYNYHECVTNQLDEKTHDHFTSRLSFNKRLFHNETKYENLKEAQQSDSMQVGQGKKIYDFSPHLNKFIMKRKFTVHIPDNSRVCTECSTVMYK